jgi:hypothetical protein
METNSLSSRGFSPASSSSWPWFVPRRGKSERADAGGILGPCWVGKSAVAFHGGQCGCARRDFAEITGEATQPAAGDQRPASEACGELGG